MSETEQDAEIITVYVAASPQAHWISQDSFAHALRKILKPTLRVYTEAWVNLYEVEGPKDSDLRVSGNRVQIRPDDDDEIVRHSGAGVSFEDLDDLNDRRKNIDTIRPVFTEFINDNFDF